MHEKISKRNQIRSKKNSYILEELQTPYITPVLEVGYYFSLPTYLVCSLVGFWAGLGWLVLVYCERKTLLAGWFGLAETNKRTG